MVVRLMHCEKIGVPLLRELAVDIAKRISESKSLVLTNEALLCKELENVYYSFWILEHAVLRCASAWSCKEGTPLQ